jgi:uncharacterized damage-inducible protein DinB
MALEALPDEALGVSVRAGGRSVGEVLRHILAIEEGLLLSALLGEPYDKMRPATWSAMNAEEKAAYYEARFGNRTLIAHRIREHTLLGLDYLARTDAGERMAIRKTPWGQEWTVHYIVWHLEEHLVHHRAQVYLGLRANGYGTPEVE